MHCSRIMSRKRTSRPRLKPRLSRVLAQPQHRRKVLRFPRSSSLHLYWTTHSVSVCVCVCGQDACPHHSPQGSNQKGHVQRTSSDTISKGEKPEENWQTKKLKPTGLLEQLP
jgi:hypothetical protein